MNKILLSIILFISSIYAFGTTYKPVSDGNFNISTTWNPLGVPGSADDIYYAWASVTRTVTLTSDHTINNFTLKGGSLTLVFTASTPCTLTINGDLNISNNATFILSNNITLVVNGQTNLSGDGGTLSVNSGATAVFNDDFTVSGNGSNITVETGSGIDINSTMTITNGATALDIYGTMEIDDLSASGGSQEINVYSSGSLTINNDATFSGDAGFDVKNSGTVNVKGDMTVDWNGSGNVDGILDVDGTLTTPNANPALVQVGSSGVLTAGKIVGDVAGDGTIVDESTLPITLTFFKGYTNNTENILIWQTSSEINNDYFLLEYSYDAQNWDVLSTVKGNGNTNKLIDYSFVTYPKKPVVYYRLIQFDYNGDFEIFNIISVVNANIIKNNIKTFDFSGYKINIYNVAGALIYTDIDNFNSDILNKGIYLLEISDYNNSKITIKYYKK